MTLTGYQQLIQATTGCTDDDAPVIEEVMRVRHPTLDNIDRPTFRRLARTAQEALAILREQGLWEGTFR